MKRIIPLILLTVMFIIYGLSVTLKPVEAKKASPTTPEIQYGETETGSIRLRGSASIVFDAGAGDARTDTIGTFTEIEAYTFTRQALEDITVSLSNIGTTSGTFDPKIGVL